MIILIWVALWGGLNRRGEAAEAGAVGAASQSKGVTVQPFRGWNDSVFLDVSGVRAVVVPAVGGRIMHYGVGGENILYENPQSFGRVWGDGRAPVWMGGSQIDIGPELRGIPEHSLLWMGPYQTAAVRDYSVKVASAPDPTLGLQIEKEILIEPGSGDLGITQTLRNISASSASYCLWDRTLCRNDGFALIPLQKKSRFRAGWSLRRSVNERFVYDGDAPESPNVRVLKGFLVARCNGPATKVGVDSEAGWIAYVRGRLLLVKYFPYDPRGNYSDGGNSVELYFDERVAELEPLSPEVSLKPGESYVFPEKWVLLELPEEALTFEQARALVKKIPPSPFRR